MIEYDPIFGKNVIETLSEGMYDNPLFLFREYVQNAADAIDSAVKQGLIRENEGFIKITIDKENRMVSFEDNGIGIRNSEVTSTLTNIGNSSKKKELNKGFRGIGRLGGLGYCNTVRFETTSAEDDVKTYLEWDAIKLHEILANSSNSMDAGELVKTITATRHEMCDKSEHGFKVSLLRVKHTNDDLLDIEKVRQYLSMVCPVPFDKIKFPLADKIYEFVKKNDLPYINEYHIELNNETIFKGYETSVNNPEGQKAIEILDVDCQLLNDRGKNIGWFWYGISKFEGVLPKWYWQRCIRLRKSNIQIGESDCLSNHTKHESSLWKEDRGNGYFVGEVHIIDSGLIPNSRRDYFNQDECCRAFEFVLSEKFKELNTLYHYASKIRTSVLTIQQTEKEETSYHLKENGNAFYDAKDQKIALDKVKTMQGKADDARKTLQKIQKVIHEDKRDIFLPVFNAYASDVPQKVKKEKTVFGAEKKTLFVTDVIPPATHEVLDKVFKVIEVILPPGEAKALKDAILMKFRKS